jgi:hypothetical protein
MSQKIKLDILKAIDDPIIFGNWFRDHSTWRAWRAFLSVLFALPLDADQLALYTEFTGRQTPPTTPVAESYLICGRRAGKSAVLALVAVYLAIFRSYKQHLAPGEVATIRIMSSDRDQSRTILRYIGGLLRGNPQLAKRIIRETSESFELNNRVVIEVGSASFRATRGYSFAAVLCDELAFWRSDESTNPDVEILRAIRPGLMTIPDSKLLIASSPYARKGALWDAFQRYYGKDDASVLVWRAATRSMNPTISAVEIEAEYDKDPASAAAEYGAEFRTDVETFISIEAVRACIQPDVRERPPMRHHRYYAFCDPSGGSNDSMTLSVCHKEGATILVDAIREAKPQFSPEAVVEEIAKLLKAYRITLVYGDRYAGEWPREQFKRHGINYEHAGKSKSDLYLDLLPLINSGGVDLLDSDRLLHQLVSLERRTARGGRDSIDHPRGAHDDVCNACAGAIVMCAERPAGWRRRDREPERGRVVVWPKPSDGYVTPSTAWMWPAPASTISRGPGSLRYSFIVSTGSFGSRGRV